MTSLPHNIISISIRISFSVRFFGAQLFFCICCIVACSCRPRHDTRRDGFSRFAFSDKLLTLKLEIILLFFFFFGPLTFLFGGSNKFDGIRLRSEDVSRGIELEWNLLFWWGNKPFWGWINWREIEFETLNFEWMLRTFIRMCAFRKK